MNKFRKGVYIRNIEGVDAYKLSLGKRNILTTNWTGYIPFSKELIRLQQTGFNLCQLVFDKIEDGKNEKGKSKYKYVNPHYTTRPMTEQDLKNDVNNKSLDIVNVSFTCGYSILDEDEKEPLRDEIKQFKTEKKELSKQIQKLRVSKQTKLNLVTMNQLKSKRDTLKQTIYDRQDKINEKISADELRNIFYANGFDDENGIHYVLFKRSSSKSRKGDAMFIRQELAKEMIAWGRMNIDFPNNEIIENLVGLVAYSALVSSAIEDALTIDPARILIIDDINSKWLENAKLVVKGQDDYLEVKDSKKKIEVESCPTDGSSLLDIKYYEDGIDFKLLRNHFFKSCAFKCDIQRFYRDYCEAHGIDYDTFIVENMFGEEMLAKDVDLIITPNSLKALGFAKYIQGGTKQDMWHYWKGIVKQDDNLFGVCKHNKSSKWVIDGEPKQRMSYQTGQNHEANKWYKRK